MFLHTHTQNDNFEITHTHNMLNLSWGGLLPSTILWLIYTCDAVLITDAQMYHILFYKIWVKYVCHVATVVV